MNRVHLCISMLLLAGCASQEREPPAAPPTFLHVRWENDKLYAEEVQSVSETVTNKNSEEKTVKGKKVTQLKQVTALESRKVMVKTELPLAEYKLYYANGTSIPKQEWPRLLRERTLLLHAHSFNAEYMEIVRSSTLVLVGPPVSWDKPAAKAPPVIAY